MPETRSLSAPRRTPDVDTAARLPTLHPRPSTRTLALARIAIVATILIWLVYAVDSVARLFLEPWRGDPGFALSSLAYLVVVTVLTVSALLYLVARQGALERVRGHVRVPRAALDRFFADRRPPVTVLVPSVDQDVDAIRRSLWSAALQEYPALRVVHLLDAPDDLRGGREALRRVAAEVAGELAPLSARFSEAQQRFERDVVDPGPSDQAVSVLADHYAWAAAWLHGKANAQDGRAPADRFFADEVLAGLGDELELTAVALFAAENQGEAPDRRRMAELYRRLVWIFDAELDTFERRDFAALSADDGRTANLNAYLGLMGGSYRREDSPEGVILHESPTDEADMTVPDADFVVTLDASSLLLRDYCLRLVHLLEQPLNARVAVTQTPYSSIARADTRLGRTVDAATDLQHLQQQGMSRFGATFLGGSAAMLRMSALRSIVETDVVGGFEVRRYFRGRTAWEDVESSVDLEAHGWSILNYPERLGFVDTPADFGSLVAVRRRRASGGVLVLPPLFRQIAARRARGERVALLEVLLRVNAITSAAVASVALLFLLAFPHDGSLPGIVFLLLALPYFLSRGADLQRAGHRYSSALSVYALQLLLLPMNLAGAFRSVRQAITNTRTPFAEVTSVKGRMVTPIVYVLVPLVLLVLMTVRIVHDAGNGDWGDVAFATFHLVLLAVAGVAFMGVRNSFVDVWVGLRSRDRVAAAGDPVGEGPAAPLDWKSVLYHGHDGGSVPRSQLNARANVPGGRHRADGSPSAAETDERHVGDRLPE